jgi:hypothetical protein
LDKPEPPTSGWLSTEEHTPGARIRSSARTEIPT